VRRNAVLARLLAFFDVRLFTSQPVILLLGATPNQEVKCLTVGHVLIFVPISVKKVCTVRASKPSTCVRSTPVMRYNAWDKSNAGTFLLRLDFRALGGVGVGSSGRRWRLRFPLVVGAINSCRGNCSQEATRAKR